MIKIGMPILLEFDNLKSNFEFAINNGFDFLELNLNFPYVKEEILNGNLEKLYKEYKLDLTLHFYDDADFGAEDELIDAYINLLNKYLDKCHSIIKKVNFHNNLGPICTISGVKNYIYEKEYDAYIKRLIGNFKKAKYILNKYNIEMVIENIETKKGADFILLNYDYFYNNGFHITYDLGHDAITNYKVIDKINLLNYPISEFHFHDSINNKCHLSLGSGNIDLKFYKDLSIKNDSYVLLEVKSSKDLEESILFFKSL